MCFWLFFIYIFAKETQYKEIRDEDLYLRAPQTIYLPYINVLPAAMESPFLEATRQPGDSLKWIKNVIESKAKQNDIPADLFLKIAQCESRLNSKAKNPKSTASGIFQFLNSTFNIVKKELGRDLDVFNPIHNIEAAAYLYAQKGSKPWQASYECWRNVETTK